MNVPFDTDEQGFGYLSLMMREGGTFDTLAPHFPEINTLYSPGYFVLVAYFSDMFKAPIHEVSLVLSHLVAFFIVLAGYALGVRFISKKAGHLFSGIILFGGGLLTVMFDSHDTTLLSTLIMISFLFFFFGFFDKRKNNYILLAGISLGVICLSHPDTLITLLSIFIPFYILIFLSSTKPDLKTYLKGFVVVPTIGVLFATPWLLKVFNLFFTDLMSTPTRTALSNWFNLVVFNGIFVPILAAIGLVFAFRSRKITDVWMAFWIILLVDFSILGLFEHFFLWIGMDIFKFSYPFGMAWNGPMIPFAYLSTLALLELYKSNLFRRFHNSFFVKSRVYLKVLNIAFIFLILMSFIAFVNSEKVISFSKAFPIVFNGEFSSAADVDAMIWLKENTPEDALVLNHPFSEDGTYRTGVVWFGGHWVPIISERKCAYFRMQPFFSDTEQAYELQEALFPVYSNPDTEESQKLVETFGVEYIIVPEILNNPESIEHHNRWRPVKNPLIQISSFDSADYLEKVFDNGAIIYKVIV